MSFSQPNKISFQNFQQTQSLESTSQNNENNVDQLNRGTKTKRNRNLSQRPEKDVYRYLNEQLRKILKLLGLFQYYQVKIECSQIKQKIEIILYLVRVVVHANFSQQMEVKNTMINALIKKINTSSKKLERDNENKDFHQKKIAYLNELREVVCEIFTLDSIPSKQIRRKLVLKLINQNTNIDNVGSRSRQANIISSALKYLDKELSRDEQGFQNFRNINDIGVQTDSYLNQNEQKEEIKKDEKEESIFDVLDFQSCRDRQQYFMNNNNVVFFSKEK